MSKNKNVNISGKEGLSPSSSASTRAVSTSVSPSSSVSPFPEAADKSLDKTFTVINQMVTDGVIESYALGGAMASLFYTEPFATFDVDTFCFINGITNELDPLRPIYDYLRPRNVPEYAEGFIIEG